VWVNIIGIEIDILFMEEIRLTTWDVSNPVNNGINYLRVSTGAGFLPSTVLLFIIENSSHHHLHAFLLKLLHCHPASIRRDTRAHLRVLPSRKTPQCEGMVWSCGGTVETQTHSIARKKRIMKPK